MEIEQYITSLFDDKIEDNILNPQSYQFVSFYPAPIGSMIREELIKEKVLLTKESLKERCRTRLYSSGKQEWVLDGTKVLVRVVLEEIIINGVSEMIPRITTPLSEKAWKFYFGYVFF